MENVDYDAAIFEAAKKWNDENEEDKESRIRKDERTKILDGITITWWCILINCIFMSGHSDNRIEDFFKLLFSLPGFIVAIFAIVHTIKFIIRFFRNELD